MSSDGNALIHFEQDDNGGEDQRNRTGPTARESPTASPINQTNQEAKRDGNVGGDQRNQTSPPKNIGARGVGTLRPCMGGLAE